VAYADFVTAMMALFIVLWLLNSSKQILVAVGGYFKDPTGTSQQVGTNMQGSGEALANSRDDMPKLREELQKKMRQLENFDKLKDHIEMTVTAEGLRIELIESEVGTLFESGPGSYRERPRVADYAGRGTGEASQQDLTRRAHGFQAVRK
jgi:chemotaxis protein MotB